jgi:crystallin, alpha B
MSLADKVVSLVHQRTCDLKPHILPEKQPNTHLIKFKNGKFHINLDVHHFKPEEVTVKTVDNTVIVEGNHEERQDEFGSVERYFVRKYKVASNESNIQTSLSSDGILTVSILPPTKIDIEQKVIPIEHTGLEHQ